MSRINPPDAWTGAARAYVGLGANLGSRERALRDALAALRAAPEVRDVRASSLYETRHVGPDPQPPHLNAVASLETRLSPRALLEALLALERRAGRERGPGRCGPRPLDLDLLLYGECRIEEPGLVVPHPRMHLRGFVLEPLAELEPNLVHPVLGDTIAALAARIRNPDAVRRLD